VQDGGLPAEPKLGFPANYFGMPAVSVAFDSFWANRPGPGGVGLQDRYAAAWRHVASRFRQEPALMGYDLLNEPWPGTVWPTCANPNGCPNFDRTVLTAFSQRVTDRIREVDRRNIVWYEPNVIYNNGPQTHHGDVDGTAGMSFHVYCLHEGLTPEPTPFDPLQAITCSLFEDLPFQRANEQSARTGDALLLSEFGATDDLDQIERIVDRAERNMVSWQYWHYCQCDDPTTSGVGPTQAVVLDAAKPPSGDNVREEKLRRLVRAYPRAIAGTPERYRFDRRNTRFSMAYSTRLPEGGRRAGDELETEIFVPRRYFEHGYRVEVEGARVVSGPNASLLRLRNEPDARRVEIDVRPAPFELEIGARKVTLDGRRRARVRVRCLFAEAGRRCSGRLKLRTRNTVTLRENGRRQRRSVRLGSSKEFELDECAQRTVTVTLPRRTTRLARRRGRTAVHALTLDGGEPTAEQSFRLRAPKR
jgi:endoglycosylceramidase